MMDDLERQRLKKALHAVDEELERTGGLVEVWVCPACGGAPCAGTAPLCAWDNAREARDV